MEELSVHIKIADRTYDLFVEPATEEIIREAAKLIQEVLKQYREMGVKDTQDALARIAFDCLVLKLKEERRVHRLQQMVYDKITRLDEVVTPAIT